MAPFCIFQKNWMLLGEIQNDNCQLPLNGTTDIREIYTCMSKHARRMDNCETEEVLQCGKRLFIVRENVNISCIMFTVDMEVSNVGKNQRRNV